MKIVTWNINSVRLRLGLLARLVAEWAPDVICLQETKTPDADFPKGPLADLGYPHQVLTGMKSYNGVAILAREPMRDGQVYHRWGKKDCRHVAATLVNGVRLHNLYIPAGGDIPDSAINEKFAHKLGFVDELADFWRGDHDPSQPAVLVGDLNIAPLEQDVWSHRQLLDVVSHTPIEVGKLTAMQQAGQWVDAVRQIIPPSEKLYSWWSYRARDWAESDRGRRLDHIWVTPPLAGRIKTAEILKAARGWEPKPSDHVPVMVVLS